MKKDKLDFYKNDIIIDLWLNNNFEKQIIKFKDRIEYRENGVLHNLEGPSIEYNNGNKEYYINGEKYNDYSVWENDSKVLLRPIKLKEIYGDDI